MYVNLSEFYRLAANRAPVIDKQSQGHGTPSNPMITPVHEFMSSIMYGTGQYGSVQLLGRRLQRGRSLGRRLI
jgi:hypothetical protein